MNSAKIFILSIAPIFFLFCSCKGSAEKVRYTRLELHTWANEFRLYSGNFDHKPAKSMEEVLQDVRLAAAKSLGTTPVPSNKENDKILEDAWGHCFRFEYKKIGSETTVVITSAGPDGVFGTEDDLVRSVVVWHDAP